MYQITKDETTAQIIEIKIPLGKKLGRKIEIQSDTANDLVQGVSCQFEHSENCDYSPVCDNKLIITIDPAQWNLITLRTAYAEVRESIDLRRESDNQPPLSPHIDRAEFDGDTASISFESEHRSILYILISGLAAKGLIPDFLLDMLNLKKEPPLKIESAEEDRFSSNSEETESPELFSPTF